MNFRLKKGGGGLNVISFFYIFSLKPENDKITEGGGDLVRYQGLRPKSGLKRVGGIKVISTVCMGLLISMKTCWSDIPVKKNSTGQKALVFEVDFTFNLFTSMVLHFKRIWSCKILYYVVSTP